MEADKEQVSPSPLGTRQDPPALYSNKQNHIKSVSFTSQQVVHTTFRQWNVLEVRLLLREHSDTEVPILIWLKGGRDNEVLSWRQNEAAADFPQVDEGFGSCSGGVAQKEVFVQVDVSPTGKLTGTAGHIKIT